MILNRTFLGWESRRLMMQQLWYFESTLIEVTYFFVVSSCPHFFSVPVILLYDMFVGTYIFHNCQCYYLLMKTYLEVNLSSDANKFLKIIVNLHKNIFLSRLEPALFDICFFSLDCLQILLACVHSI